ncbi:MAG: hypothetical protein FJX40_07025 [Alphaproteobacteria bacterium]|nr:hypothetical protein [Alphaproteobacteria bacterium]MBM3640931.1 hypothetical protein [Alphaproteobacteria bacterium]
MAALARTLCSITIRRAGTFCIALLFALAAISFAVPAHASQAPLGTAMQCSQSSKPAQTKHPFGGDKCCPLCGHSQKEPRLLPAEPASGEIAYAPPRAASRTFCVFQSPAEKNVRERSRAAPRAPPSFS